MKSLSYIPYIIVFAVLLMCNIIHAAVTGPEHGNAPIRLAKAKTTTSISPKKRSEYRGTTKQTKTNMPINRENEDSTEFNSFDDTKESKNNRVVIVDPPNGSHIEGNKFVVAMSIQTANETQFRQSYMDKKNGRLCISLDRAPLICWPLYGKMFFTEATEGEHEIVAMLWKDGILDHSSTSEKVSFTTVYNPKIIHEPKEEMLTHVHVGASRIQSNSTNAPVINIPFSAVQISSPLAKVSYTGTSIQFRSRLPIIGDIALFEKYFQSSMVCINVDIATAYSCFPIFDSNETSSNISPGVVPWLLDLSKGMHTIEAMLSHPETGELLQASSSGTTIFFMAGDNNEGAAFTGSVNIRGQRYEIPINKGGCLEAQTLSFCDDIGLSGMNACNDPVLAHLKEVALQIGFVSLPC